MVLKEILCKSFSFWGQEYSYMRKRLVNFEEVYNFASALPNFFFNSVLLHIYLSVSESWRPSPLSFTRIWIFSPIFTGLSLPFFMSLSSWRICKNLRHFFNSVFLNRAVSHRIQRWPVAYSAYIWSITISASVCKKRTFLHLACVKTIFTVSWQCHKPFILRDFA